MGSNCFFISKESKIGLIRFISKNQNMMIATYLILLVCVCPTWYHKTEDILLVSWLKLVDPNAGAKHDIEWPLRLVWVHDTSILNHSHLSCKVKNKDIYSNIQYTLPSIGFA